MFRTFAFIFAAIVNDLIFAYNVLMLLCWIVFIIASVYGWLLVYSLYIELSDLTKLEDLAQLRVNIQIFQFNRFFFYFFNVFCVFSRWEQWLRWTPLRLILSQVLVLRLLTVLSPQCLSVNFWCIFFYFFFCHYICLKVL